MLRAFAATLLGRRSLDEYYSQDLQAKTPGYFQRERTAFSRNRSGTHDQEPTELAALAVNVVLDEDSTVSTASYNLFASFCF